MHQFLRSLLNGPTHFTLSHHFNPALTIFIIVVSGIVEVLAAYGVGVLLVKALQNIRPFFRVIVRISGVGEKKIPHSFLELTFPSDTTKSAFATEQLHILLRTLVRYRGFLDSLAAHKKPYSLELVSTNNEGIRYVIMVPTSKETYVQRDLLSFLPGLKIRVVDDYVTVDTSSDSRSIVVRELRLSAPFAWPLKDHTTLADHDPIAYLTGQMTKLAAQELLALQIVTVPIGRNTHTRVLREVRKLRYAIAHGREVSSKLAMAHRRIPHSIWLIYMPPIWAMVMLFKVIISIPMAIADPENPTIPLLGQNTQSKKRSYDPYEKELSGMVRAKIDQPLFEVTIRVYVAAASSEAAEHKVKALIGAFQTYTSPYQDMIERRHPVFLSHDALLRRFKNRTLSPHIFTKQTILSSSELSDLYHFPTTKLTKTEGLVTTRSSELPPPLSILHSEAKLDVVVGVNEHGGAFQPIGMTIEQRQKHTYVIGKTGMGKTTLLTSVIYQDMVSGKGLAVLDPHGDMFQELLSIVPKHRQKDVIVFDPSDRDYPIGLNVLDPGIDFASDEDRDDWITNSVIAVFKKLSDEKQWGSRMEHILRNATLTALQLQNPSLYTIQRLLTDKKFRKEAALSLKDPVLKQFWQKEFAMLGSMQVAAAIEPLTHRLGHFITTTMSRHILLQQKSSLRIADIMNEGKILLVNLSKGDIGEDQSLFFGTILTSFIWMAAYQRTKIPETQRRDFFLYVDEFQNFATPQFSETVSEGRKFHISLILSHQNIAQIEDSNLIKLIASNSSTLITLKVGPEDEAFMVPYMKPEVRRGDILNLAPYHFYMKTTAQSSEAAFSGVTVPFDASELDDSSDDVIALSRKQYGIPKIAVLEQIDTLFVTEKTNYSRSPVSDPKPVATSLDSLHVHGA